MDDAETFTVLGQILSTGYYPAVETAEADCMMTSVLAL
jgi:hypothetical protein